MGTLKETNTKTIKSGKFKLSDLLRSVNDLHEKLVYGCGNHGCVIESPSGMGTNAICRCRPKHIAADLRRLADAVESAGTSWPDENNGADFLWPHDDGSVEQAVYEFANARTEDYRREWRNILRERIVAESKES